MPMRIAERPAAQRALFALPSMARFAKAIDAEFDRYIARHKADLPSETIGVGRRLRFSTVRSCALNSGETRFVLAGIVNRMDRAYVSPETCGEIRLIYRLTRIDAAADGKAATRRGCR